MKYALCLLLLLLPTPVSARIDWSTVAEKIAKSVVYLEASDGACTGFVINTNQKNDEGKGDFDYVLTAAHCDGKELYADQAVTKILFKDTKKDLMVLEVSDLGRPALTIAHDNPKRGQEVMSFGYGYALERPMLRVTHIADDNTYIPEGGVGGPLMATDAAFVGGQSGGPVINENGEVVMIVQRGTSVVGLGVGAEVIRSRAGRYLAKPIKP